MCVLFFFNDTATTEIYTLSLHDALPILSIYPSATLFEFTSADDLNEALARGLPGVRVSDRLAVVADEKAVDFRDRKSTRLNSSHANLSYAVFCLKKNTDPLHPPTTILLH